MKDVPHYGSCPSNMDSWPGLFIVLLQFLSTVLLYGFVTQLEKSFSDNT